LFKYIRASSTHCITVLFASRFNSCFAFKGLAKDIATSHGLLDTISYGISLSTIVSTIHIISATDLPYHVHILHISNTGSAVYISLVSLISILSNKYFAAAKCASATSIT
jgi:hypothetical protein